MAKINIFKMDVWTFWSQLLSCYAFYIVPNCIRNQHTEFEIDKTILTYKIINLKRLTDGLTLIIEKLKIII